MGLPVMAVAGNPAPSPVHHSLMPILCSVNRRENKGAYDHLEKELDLFVREIAPARTVMLHKSTRSDMFG